jgi:hypothetical protein
LTLKYNGYTFNDYTHVTVDAEMVYDDAGRTVLYHRYRLHVETTIYAEAGDSNVGRHFQRIRQLLSKSGQELIIEHDGFGPKLNVNGLSNVSDVLWGPKPRMLKWEPIGAENAVFVTWECEFHLPTCEGTGYVHFKGLATLNYSISWSIVSGYTTRTITGYLQIAMTRDGGGTLLPDTADRYREFVVIPRPPNFERTTTWSLSLDKTRADFSIVDTEINSPHPYPPGVTAIRANHRVGWSRRALATLPNVISANVTLAPGQPRSRAWEIFRLICADRINIASQGRKVFLESLDVDEALYDHSISFSLSYRLYFGHGQSAIGEIFTATGLFTKPYGDWVQNSAIRDQFETHRGLANMAHDKTTDQIVDLCTTDIASSNRQAYAYPPYTNSTYMRFCNEKPQPYESWLRFEGALTSIEDNPAAQQISIGKDDLRRKDFNPSDPAGTIGDTDAGANIKRYVEEAPAGMVFEWMGYAERVGYDIPRPNKLTFGNKTLVRHGEGVFRKKFVGTFFCQPLYAASWKLRYVVEERPEEASSDEADPINRPEAAGA